MADRNRMFMKNRKLEILMAAVVLIAAAFLSRHAAVSVMSVNVEKRPERVVCIDAGHGGSDPGKVGINKALEKDINLLIARRVRTLLVQNDVKVVMTRETDEGLYDEESTNHKSQDMKRRCALINETAPAFTVSIHQNSYHEEYVKGAQVFYYENSDGGKELAECLQNQLIAGLKDGNTRQAKSNDAYYLLLNTNSPTVIVECGFLSNSEEASLLIQEEYQEKISWQICMGILKYLNAQK